MDVLLFLYLLILSGLLHVQFLSDLRVNTTPDIPSFTLTLPRSDFCPILYRPALVFASFDKECDSFLHAEERNEEKLRKNQATRDNMARAATRSGLLKFILFIVRMIFYRIGHLLDTPSSRRRRRRN